MKTTIQRDFNECKDKAVPCPNNNKKLKLSSFNDKNNNHESNRN